MKTCSKDTKVVETVYPSADYIEEYDTYGKRAFLTLKSTHSPGLTITRVIQCEACQTERAKPDIQRRLQNAQSLEGIDTAAETDIKNRAIAKSLGLTTISTMLGVKCSKCGTMDSVRNDKTREPLCASCYQTYRKEYKRDYMRDFMRTKRETNHVV